MTFWTFLDKQISRLNPSGVAGAGIFVLTGAVLFIIVHHPELADNDLFKTLAQAIIVQGLIGLAMAAWFTKKADEGPLETKITNDADEPVPVEPQKR